jgi:hypothetical protein
MNKVSLFVTSRGEEPHTTDNVNNKCNNHDVDEDSWDNDNDNNGNKNSSDDNYGLIMMMGR